MTHGEEMLSPIMCTVSFLPHLQDFAASNASTALVMTNSVAATATAARNKVLDSQLLSAVKGTKWKDEIRQQCMVFLSSCMVVLQFECLAVRCCL